MDLEHAFLQDIREHPGDASLWLILADWLEDHNDARAELVRLTQALRSEPDHAEFDARQRRVQALIAGGMRPLVPTLTNSIGMTLALIPAGTFLMGTPPDEPDHEEDEGPRHRVQLTRPYYLGTTTVTQKQYRRVIKRNPSQYNNRNQGSGEHPVERIGHSQAHAFCLALAALPQEQKHGRTYRLPTEAEWEYACRAGTTTPYHFGDELTGALANFDTVDHSRIEEDNGAPRLLRTCPVAQYPPNAWGLHDMHGNVWEWCQDWFYDYPSEEQVDPVGDDDNLDFDLRVIRGGGWNSYARWCRSGRRSNTGDDTADSDLGFRVVCEWTS